MCQLTFTNLVNPDLAKKYLTLQMLINSKYSHKDGYGFFSIDSTISNIDKRRYKLFKSEKTPNSVTNFGEMINLHSCGGTLIGHVRQATTTNFMKKVEREASHPFLGKRFVLAHNGTLEFKDSKRMNEPQFNDLIDSQIFLNRLEQLAERKPFIPSIQRTMEEFKGKFAFLIYDSLDNTFYIVRGFSADLYKSTLFLGDEYLGYVVNTKEDDLKYTLNLLKHMENSYGNININLNDEDNAKNINNGVLSYTAPLLLESETIFKVNDDLFLADVGAIVETPKISYAPINTIGGLLSNRHVYGNRGNGNNIKNNDNSLINKALEIGITLEELDELLYMIMGSSILTITYTDETYLLESVFPLLKLRYSRKKEILWEKLISKLGKGTLDVYNVSNLQFPYMINKLSVLKKAFNKAKRSVKT